MRRTSTCLLLAAVLAASCSGPPAAPDDDVAGVVVVTDEPSALEAMADTLSGSLRWTGALEVALDRSEVDTAMQVVADTTGEQRPPEARAWLDELEEHVELARASSAHGALADDGSWQVAFDHRRATWLDLRFGLGEVLDARTMTPEATILARIGWEPLIAMIEEVEAWDVRGEMRRTADDPANAGDPLGAVLHALADGDWGGLAGTIDLAELGVAAGDLDAHAQEFRRQVAGVADRETMLRLADEALTVRDHEQRDGLTVATVDLHPRDAAFAIADLFDDAAHLADADAERLPETVEAAARITFDAQGRLVEVRTDVLALAAHALDADDDPSSRATAEAIRGLERTSAEVVFAMTDHGQVPTVVDEDAVTMPWGELAEVLLGGLYEERGEW